MPGRGDRPFEVPPRKPQVTDPALCPFCPGHEAELEEILEETPGPAPAGWATRTVPNKYPGVHPDLEGESEIVGPYQAEPALGRHEVIIETPNHDRDLPAMAPAERQAVVGAYHRRFARMGEETPALAPVLFRNRGPGSGASLAHPHAQIIAGRGLPPGLARREAAMSDHFESFGRCALCDMVAFEQADGARIVGVFGSILAFVPFAASGPSEIWLAPMAHAADFGGAGEAELGDLAAALGDVLGRLGRGLDDPDYNLILCSLARAEDAPHLHWWIEIRPRLTIWGGYELATAVNVVPSVPEADARRLRQAEA